MSEALVQGLITTGGIIIVALISVWTARLTKKAGESQAKVEERAKVVEGYDKLNEDLQIQNTKLSESIAKLDEKVNTLSTEIEACRRRIYELETERDKQQRDFRTIVRYCKILIQILRDNNIPVPAQPLDILDYG